MKGGDGGGTAGDHNAYRIHYVAVFGVNDEALQENERVGVLTAHT